MTEWLTYREAAQRVHRSTLTVKRWRRRGQLHMSWEIRNGQRVRVVQEEHLLACWRERMKSDPVHQQRIAQARREEGESRSLWEEVFDTLPVNPPNVMVE